MAQSKKINNNTLPPDLAKTDAGLFLRDFVKDPEFRLTPEHEASPLYIKGIGDCVSLSVTKIKVFNDDGTSFIISIREAFNLMDRNSYKIPETDINDIIGEFSKKDEANGVLID